MEAPKQGGRLCGESMSRRLFLPVDLSALTLRLTLLLYTALSTYTLSKVVLRYFGWIHASVHRQIYRRLQRLLNELMNACRHVCLTVLSADVRAHPPEYFLSFGKGTVCEQPCLI